MNEATIKALVERFLQWPVPASCYPDGTPGKPGRTGTNLLSYTEAKEMLEYVLASSTAKKCPFCGRLEGALCPGCPSAPSDAPVRQPVADKAAFVDAVWAQMRDVALSEPDLVKAMNIHTVRKLVDAFWNVLATSPLPTVPGAREALSEPDAQLCKFYAVSTFPELVAAMLHHIEKLQAKLPATPLFAPQRVREG